MLAQLAKILRPHTPQRPKDPSGGDVVYWEEPHAALSPDNAPLIFKGIADARDSDGMPTALDRVQYSKDGGKNFLNVGLTQAVGYMYCGVSRHVTYYSSLSALKELRHPRAR